ncbi:SPRY3-like protein, partial [Mya arenaria]
LYLDQVRGDPFGSKCGQGDRIGCGVRYLSSRTDIVDVFFTKNGPEIGSRRVNIPNGGLFPAVGMKSDGERVRLDMDAAFGTCSKSQRNPRMQGLTSCLLTATVLGAIGAVAIGLVPEDYPNYEMPGWRENLYIASGHGDPFGSLCGRGDRMGCGVRFIKQSLNAIDVYFTKNGGEVGSRRINLSSGGLFPAIGMHSNGEKVRILTLQDGEADVQKAFANLTIQMLESDQAHAKIVSSGRNVEHFESNTVPGRKREVNHTENASDFVLTNLEGGLHDEVCDSVTGRRRGESSGDAVGGRRRRCTDRK